MFPAAFDYRAPASLQEALSILKERGDDAKVMAGGQSLIPLLKLRFARPELVVDIGRLPSMNNVMRRGGHTAIGALVRHVDVENSKELASSAPMMVEAARWISDPLVRNRGTLAGSVCHADPAGDWGSVMLAFGAEIVARSLSGERVLRADEFFEGPFATVLKPDEVVTEVRIPLANGRAGGAYLKLERKVGDFATVAVAVQVQLEGEKVSRAGIGLTAVGPRNIKATDAERSLMGQEPTDRVIAEAARLAAEAAEPKDDVRGSAAYKKDVVRVFVQRGLKTAIGRAREVKS
ncbi:MAG: xanthine dehydrogenase family protein subunit M [Chloroflexi bacterium]|nr:MAG: carbon monoxide dehydrogenase [Actinobacteria bacterium 13_2_20CM_2_66_6]TMF79096.1 MAG: xanthine dehydrogenase family protein subunit M [Chloroflexota bacterium]TMG43777.1 MAG: xanthine dehydrogenase family protein subunit M [Chloroflexota bacterium]